VEYKKPFGLGVLAIVLGALCLEYRYRLMGDPRKPFVLIALGYLTLVVVAVYLDYRHQLWRAKKRRETKQVNKEK
jgi:hypothetical protein